MSTNYVQEGDDLTVTAPYTVASGAGCLVGNLFGFAKFAAASGASVVITTRHVWDGTKKTNDTFAVGDKVYWDDTNKYLTSTATSNKWVGIATKAALAADATVRLRLNGFGQ